MRIVFFGTSPFGIPSLERLVASGHHVCCCVTQPDRPQGRGLAPRPSAIKSAAARLGLAVAEPERLAAWAPELARLQADLGVLASYGRLVPGAVLRLPRLGIIGIHPSLLPKYRGASPIARAILEGERETGVTIYRLVEALDAGEILAQRRVAIGPDETADALTARLAVVSADALAQALAGLEAGTVTAAQQDERAATYAPKFSKDDGRIDWSRSAESIHRLVRATQPWPGAVTQLHGQAMKIRSAGWDDRPHSATPGTVLAVSPSEGLLVAAGQGRVIIRELQPAGKRRMSAADFLAGHRVRVGERLESTPSDH